MERGQVWWADIPDGDGSAPSFRRPVAIVSADTFNRSRISSVIVAAMTGNLKRAEAPGNVFVDGASVGLPRDSVINVSHLFTLDRTSLLEQVGTLPARHIKSLDEGLRLVLALP